MKRADWCWLCLVVAVLSAHLRVLRADDHEGPRVRLIAVGVSAYSNKALQPLGYANEGARKVAHALSEAQPGVTEATVLTTDLPDVTMRPTAVNIARALKDAARQAKPDDLVIFYFCGHGIEKDGEQYLLLMDADLGDQELLEKSSLELSTLRSELERMPCQGRLLILDACRESPRQTGGVLDATPMTRDFLRAAGEWRTGPGRVSATLFGCREGEKAYYGRGGQSFFTEALVEGVGGAAADKQGKVTLNGLAHFVQQKVPRLAAAEIGNDARQQPILLPPAPGDIILRPSPAYIACPNFGGEFGSLFAAKVQTYLAASGTVYLVERSLLTGAIAELSLQTSGVTDVKSALEIGRMTNAKYVLIGECMPTPDGKVYVTSRLVEVATGQAFPGIAAETTCAKDDWQDGARALAEDLLRQMTGTTIARKQETTARPSAPAQTVPAAIVQEAGSTPAQTAPAAPNQATPLAPITPAVAKLPPTPAASGTLTPMGGTLAPGGPGDIGIEAASAEGGILVAGLGTDSPAAKAGLRRGDVITQFGEVQAPTVEAFAAALQGTPVGQAVPVTARRGAGVMNGSVTVGSTSEVRGLLGYWVGTVGAGFMRALFDDRMENETRGRAWEAPGEKYALRPAGKITATLDANGRIRLVCGQRSWTGVWKDDWIEARAEGEKDEPLRLHRNDSLSAHDIGGRMGVRVEAQRLGIKYGLAILLAPAMPYLFLGEGQEVVRVTAIEPGSAAEQAGFQLRDTIYMVSGWGITKPDDLTFLVRRTPIGRTLSVWVSRRDKWYELKVRVQAPTESGR